MDSSEVGIYRSLTFNLLSMMIALRCFVLGFLNNLFYVFVYCLFPSPNNHSVDI